jgi:hypothetical protein
MGFKKIVNETVEAIPVIRLSSIPADTAMGGFCTQSQE